MKKLILLSAFITTAFLVNAQTPGFTLGPKVGATFSKYSYDFEDMKTEATNTFHWGAFVRLGEKVYIQPELLFMKRSGTLLNNAFSDGEQRIDLRTIDIPVLLGVRVADFKLTNVRVFAGPVGTMVIDRSVELEDWQDAINEDDVRGATWALQFGAGVDVLVFTVDLRYELGMGDFSELEDYSLKNNLVTLSVGWKIL